MARKTVATIHRKAKAFGRNRVRFGCHLQSGHPAAWRTVLNKSCGVGRASRRPHPWTIVRRGCHMSLQKSKTVPAGGDGGHSKRKDREPPRAPALPPRSDLHSVAIFAGAGIVQFRADAPVAAPLPLPPLGLVFAAGRGSCARRIPQSVRSRFRYPAFAFVTMPWK